MTRVTFGLAAASAVVLAGCGGGSHFTNRHRPPTAIDLTVYINNSTVSVSPGSVGAGPINFLVTNQARQTESLTIHGAGGTSLATTGPINPGAPAQLTVDLSSPGDYSVGASGGGSITPATLHIGRARQAADNALLQP